MVSEKTDVLDGDTELTSLELEYSQLVENIRELIKRRKVVKRRINKLTKAPSNKLSKYYEKPIFLYVLKLEDDCWYVGTTRNVERRFKTHYKGKGAIWTKEHRPIEIHQSGNTGLVSDSEACRLEDKVTIEYVRRYGTQKVRGGGYCQRSPNWPDYIIE